MSVELIEAPRVARVGDRRELVAAFLSAYWLRPENAMWMALRSEALSEVELVRPSLDVSCGDGIFSFLHAGGRLGESFDVFGCVERLDRVRTDHADMFDCVDDGYRPVITKVPAYSFDVGTDFKPSSLARAEALAFYGRLVEHDNNSPLPFPDACFRSIYCNSAYWVKRIDAFLHELRRILHPSGRLVLHVKLDSMREYTLERHRGQLGGALLDIIGRGRADCWPTVTDRPGWEARFASAGLRIDSASAFAGPTQARIWDIGLRPVAPLLVKMANGLTSDRRAQVKREWVSLLLELVMPFCDPGLELFPESAEPAELQYVLARAS